MKKVTERDIVSFAAELAKKLWEADSELIDDEGQYYFFRWSNKKICIGDICDNDMSADEILENAEQTEEDVKEFTGYEKNYFDCNYIAYFSCEGTLYEKISEYDSYGSDGSERCEQNRALYRALNICGKYGMSFDPDCGSYSFYDTNEANHNYYKISIENYLNYSCSICREERQYALFLYNILRKYHSPKKRTEDDFVTGVFNACGLSDKADIENVFYEVTFMRDFFERNRRLMLGDNPNKDLLKSNFKPTGDWSNNKPCYKMPKEDSFNAKLLKYATGSDKSYIGEEYNLGARGSGLVKEMMNAAPDIAVVYREDDKKYLLFIECKFESGEDTYKSGNKQCHVQWCIADFLCKNYLTDLTVSPIMKDERSHLVKFVREKNEKSSKDNEIEIDDLISINDNWILN